MSIQAVAWVLDNSATKGAHRLVLLSLANHANDESECWPSIRRVAYEANITEDHAQRCLGELVDRGYVTRVVNGAPDQRIRWDRRPNLYRITHGGVRIHPPWFNGGVNDAETGGGTAQPRGGTDPPPNHHGNRHKESSSSSRSLRTSNAEQREPGKEKMDEDPIKETWFNPYRAYSDCYAQLAYERRSASIGPPAHPSRWRRKVSEQWARDNMARLEQLVEGDLLESKPKLSVDAVVDLIEKGEPVKTRKKRVVVGCAECGFSGWHEDENRSVIRCESTS